MFQIKVFPPCVKGLRQEHNRGMVPAALKYSENPTTAPLLHDGPFKGTAFYLLFFTGSLVNRLSLQDFLLQMGYSLPKYGSDVLLSMRWPICAALYRERDIHCIKYILQCSDRVNSSMPLLFESSSRLYEYTRSRISRCFLLPVGSFHIWWYIHANGRGKLKRHPAPVLFYPPASVSPND